MPNLSASNLPASWTCKVLTLALASLLLHACASSDPQSVTQTTPQTTSKNAVQNATKKERDAMPVLEVAEFAVPQTLAVAPNAMMIRSPHFASPAHLPQKNRENYAKTAQNAIKQTITDPIATLSIDTDTASYANVRRFLNQGEQPPKDAVRVEELINYFNYQFDHAKKIKNAPFVVATELVQSPWQNADQDNQILAVSLASYDALAQSAKSTQVKKLPSNSVQKLPSNLVFLVDVSGSMRDEAKLPLVKSALKLLTKTLDKNDTISLITYAGETKVALEATTGDQKAKINQAIDALNAQGSTNGENALRMAYDQAEKHFNKRGINRILMLTDGDFNVGIDKVDDMVDLVKSYRDKGISLSTLGFGTGNLNDHMMEQMADNGNGNYSYIDSLTEAKKVLADEQAATFNTVAKDVKIQLEFNPNRVKEWRLIGYENRLLAEQDFTNDKIDAGDLGAGKSVLALFEITPSQAKGAYPERRYQTASSKPTAQSATQFANEIGYLKIRYKTPTGKQSTQIDFPITQTVQAPSPQMQFALAVAGFGQRLKQSPYIHDWQFDDSKKLATQAIKNQKNASSTQTAFIDLVDLAGKLEP